MVSPGKEPSVKALVPAAAFVLAALGSPTPAWADPGPTSRLAYEDLAGPNGRTLTIEGKSWGPYREVVQAVPSTSGTQVAFGVRKGGRLAVVAQGREWPPVPQGFDLDRLQISDDGRVCVLTATKASNDGSQVPQTLLMVNGKVYGPYQELTTVEYAEAGGTWLAAVRTGNDEADLLWNGRSQGPFYTVDHAWLQPDGQDWGYAVSDSEGVQSVVTPAQTWTGVSGANFSAMYPREPHWAYAFVLADGTQRIVVDGQGWEGLQGFQALVFTPSGRHWGFEAARTDTGQPVVVVDGKEYPGTDLNWHRLGASENFTWTEANEGRVQVKVWRLP